MSLIESGNGEVIINRMDIELLEGVDWSDSVLPNVAHDIVETSLFEHIDRIWRHPILHVNVSN